MNTPPRPGRLATALLLVALPAAAQVTPLGRDTQQAIDDGIAWMAAQGAFQEVSACGDAVGLCALALLRRPRSADLNEPLGGYADARAEDRPRLDRLVRQIIARAGRPFYAFGDGAGAMALTDYLLTGGPDPNALLALDAMIDRILDNQTQVGHWCYRAPGCDDGATTRFALAGLRAARRVYSHPDHLDPQRYDRVAAAIERAWRGYEATRTAGALGDEAGNGIRPRTVPGLGPSTVALWAGLIAGQALDEPPMQRRLRWLRNRYAGSTISGARGGYTASWHFYLWTLHDAFTAMHFDAAPRGDGQIGLDDIGALPPDAEPAYARRTLRLDPATTARVARFGDEGPGYYDHPILTPWYFDLAWWLMSRQDADGRFRPGEDDMVFNALSAQVYALLVLGGRCLRGCGGAPDADFDGVPDAEDACPEEPDPSNIDRDGDGVGDACDNCPDDINVDQADSDGDGIGDACEVGSADLGLPDLGPPPADAGPPVDASADALADPADALVDPADAGADPPDTGAGLDPDGTPPDVAPEAPPSGGCRQSGHRPGGGWLLGLLGLAAIRRRAGRARREHGLRTM